MQGNIKPLNDFVLIERIDGDGREEIRPSGLILPAVDRRLRHGNSHAVPDTYRARVLAVGPEARRLTLDQLGDGDEVLVHTYDQRPDKTLAGEETAHGFFVRVDDIIGILGPDASADTSPFTCMRPKTKNFEPPESVGE